MTAPAPLRADLTDPEAAFFATNPGELKPPGTVEPPEATDSSQRQLAAVALLAFLLVRHRLASEPPSPDPTLTAHDAWRKVAPLWLQAAAPVVQEVYRLHLERTLTEPEIADLASDYAASLGDYLNDSSADALTDGFERQLAAGWDERVAWARARAAYGLNKREMRTLLGGLRPGQSPSPEILPTAMRALVDRAVIARADSVGQAEAHSSVQAGQRIAWMLLARRGALPADSRVQWETGDDDPCPVCRALHGQQVGLTDPFVEPSGRKLWSPQAHPRCHCILRLIRPELAKAATTVAGVCLRAADTGRILLLQRAQDGKDPNGGLWEFPGGHLESGEAPLEGAVREWQEEVGRRLPPHRIGGNWQHGIYQGFVLVVPHEDAVPTHRRGSVVNPDDPDRDQVEAIAWWDPEHLARNPAVRPEVRFTLAKVRAALGQVAKAYDPNEPRNTRGEWTEGPRVADRERDPVVESLMAQVREAPATEPPSRYRAPEPPGASKYRAPEPSKYKPRSRYKPRSNYAEPQSRYSQPAPSRYARPRYGGRAAPRRIVHHYLLSSPAPSLDTHYMPVSDFMDAHGYEYESIGPGSPIDFDEANVNLPHNDLTAVRERNAWDAVASPTGLKHEEELQAEHLWGNVMRQAVPIWHNAQEDADQIVPRLNPTEVAKIADVAGFDPTEDTGRLRERIVRATRNAGADNSLADAYADFITFVHPSWATADASEMDAALEDALGPGVDAEAMFLDPPQVFAFANGVHPGTRVDRTLDEIYPDGDYYVAGMVYHSRVADAPGRIPPQVIGMQELLMRPDPDSGE